MYFLCGKTILFHQETALDGMPLKEWAELGTSSWVIQAASSLGVSGVMESQAGYNCLQDIYNSVE